MLHFMAFYFEWSTTCIKTTNSRKKIYACNLMITRLLSIMSEGWSKNNQTRYKSISISRIRVKLCIEFPCQRETKSKLIDKKLKLLHTIVVSWRYHDMGMFSSLLFFEWEPTNHRPILCTQKAVMRNVDVFFYVSLNKLLNKWYSGREFEPQRRPFDASVMIIVVYLYMSQSYDILFIRCAFFPFWQYIYAKCV